MIEKRQKEWIISKLQDYFYQDRQEELGLIGAENLYAFIMENIAPHIYNRGLRDARQMLELKWGQLEEELYVLEKPIKG